MNVLTIGNSFSDSVAVYLPALAEFERFPIRLHRADFGGCELERHWRYVEAEEAHAITHIYPGKLRDILAGRAWDVVTIQQASHFSWRAETYEPFAGNLIAYVKKHAPRAEVAIQQTWAYRADHPQFLPGSDWGISQTEMHEKLTVNYRELARRHQLRVIPTGDAVAAARAESPVRFVNYPPELVNALHWPDLPPQAGDVVGQCFWRKNPDTGKLELVRDLIHLNVRGQYLQACVWFGFLSGRDPQTIAFVPETIDIDDAVFLRARASQALSHLFR